MKKFVLLSLLLLPFSISAGIDISSEIKKLIANGSNPFFVHIGNSTKQTLIKRAKSIKNCIIKIKKNDAPKPIGNGNATEHAIISCAGHSTIGLRLKQEVNNKYHILGFWSINGL